MVSERVIRVTFRSSESMSQNDAGLKSTVERHGRRERDESDAVRWALFIYIHTKITNICAILLSQHTAYIIPSEFEQLASNLRAYSIFHREGH